MSVTGLTAFPLAPLVFSRPRQVLLVELDGEVLAVSNKCSHLGLPLVSRTGVDRRPCNCPPSCTAVRGSALPAVHPEIYCTSRLTLGNGSCI